MTKPKLLFVYDHKYPDKWMDGLWAALNLLEEDFEIYRENLNETVRRDHQFPLDSVGYDFCLGWGAFGSLVDEQMQLYKDDCPRGLCIAGNATPPTGATNYDVLFYETDWVLKNYLKEVRELADKTKFIHAFGFNADIYNHDPLPQLGNMSFATPIIWDYIGVGSFSNWKRWDRMKDKKGLKLVVGEYQTQDMQSNEESMSLANNLLTNGAMVSPMVSPYDLANFYQWSRICYIPADIYGGGERAVLEARACGLPVEIEDDNPKLKELVDGPLYDHVYYAKQLKKGILLCL